MSRREEFAHFFTDGFGDEGLLNLSFEEVLSLREQAGKEFDFQLAVEGLAGMDVDLASNELLELYLKTLKLEAACRILREEQVS